MSSCSLELTGEACFRKPQCRQPGSIRSRDGSRACTFVHMSRRQNSWHSRKHSIYAPRENAVRASGRCRCTACAKNKPTDQKQKSQTCNTQSNTSPDRPLAGVLSTMKQYPLSYALGVLFVGFVVPQFLAFGLVRVERAFLAFLLELEQLLVAAFLTGAKWVTLAAVLCGGVALLWYETQKKKS